MQLFALFDTSLSAEPGVAVGLRRSMQCERKCAYGVTGRAVEFKCSTERLLHHDKSRRNPSTRPYAASARYTWYLSLLFEGQLSPASITTLSISMLSDLATAKVVRTASPHEISIQNTQRKLLSYVALYGGKPSCRFRLRCFGNEVTHLKGTHEMPVKALSWPASSLETGWIHS